MVMRPVLEGRTCLSFWFDLEGFPSCLVGDPFLDLTARHLISETITSGTGDASANVPREGEAPILGFWILFISCCPSSLLGDFMDMGRLRTLGGTKSFGLALGIAPDSRDTLGSKNGGLVRSRPRCPSLYGLGGAINGGWCWWISLVCPLLSFNTSSESGCDDSGLEERGIMDVRTSAVGGKSKSRNIM